VFRLPLIKQCADANPFGPVPERASDLFWMHVSVAKNILTVRVDLPVSERSRVNKITGRTLQDKLSDKVVMLSDKQCELAHLPCNH
jgi:hypothetical protein